MHTNTAVPKFLSGNEKIHFFIFFIIMGKLHMQWQYNPQKAQQRHKTQICAKSCKGKSTNSFCTVPRKRNLDVQPPASQPPAQPPAPPRRADNLFSHLLQYPTAILAEGEKIYTNNITWFDIEI